MRLWDVASGQMVLPLEGHTKGVQLVVFSPDGKRLAGTSVDKTVKIWDVAGGMEGASQTGGAKTRQGETRPDAAGNSPDAWGLFAIG